MTTVTFDYSGETISLDMLTGMVSGFPHLDDLPIDQAISICVNRQQAEWLRSHRRIAKIISGAAIASKALAEADGAKWSISIERVYRSMSYVVTCYGLKPFEVKLFEGAE